MRGYSTNSTGLGLAALAKASNIALGRRDGAALTVLDRKLLEGGRIEKGGHLVRNGLGEKRLPLPALTISNSSPSRPPASLVCTEMPKKASFSGVLGQNWWYTVPENRSMLYDGISITNISL